ncbi:MULTISPECIES: TetR/AcrR family transcriptional regulator [unclassified Curtobacterium]|uniref:TetR/AcrR family transcriptional regulator n=1 Tax=unclassified Curtobacterium TaxID=257496 RepID=UPI000825A6B9|nr:MULTISPECIES: TetR family transcriptional regulator [unclassified Curtobacterium]WIA95999.1 hypothetical protein QOL16_12905 [Curtobacterium sp. MCBA15_004]WIA99301.1 hypothetical protein QOL15_12320 [Curtobacterium sp. MCBA15_012]
MGRREELADAGIRLAARGGSRALTHRAVDQEAAVPPGSTSYYASTRRDLTALVVDRITDQLAVDLSDLVLPPVPDDDAVVAIALGFLDRLAARADAQAARLALLVDLRDDDLRTTLTGDDPAREALVAVARTLLVAVGAADVDRRAVDLVGLVDALLLYRVADVAPVDARAVVAAFVAGLPRR